ncbi:MAG: hypothetical protein K6T34_05400 [Thermoflavifilum sp.]|nr:hypothetical protein [Thermoflavifilum sp.]
MLWYISNKAVGQSIKKLPLIEVPAQTRAESPFNDYLAILITGDGGWKITDKQLCDEFVTKGIPVVALNALKYFWSKKTPEQATAIVELLMQHYMEQWHKHKVILMGFSFGADVLPFIINRMNYSLYQQLSLIVMLSPGTSTDFEIHISQMLNKNTQWKYNVVEEIQHLREQVPVLCIFGDEESTFPVQQLPKFVQVAYVKGGHHYEENHTDISSKILSHLPVHD